MWRKRRSGPLPPLAGLQTNHDEDYINDINDDNNNGDNDDIYIMMKCVFVCDCLKHHVENV